MCDAPVPTDSGVFGHIRMYSRVEMEQMLDYAGLRLDRWELSNWHHTAFFPESTLRDRARLLSQQVVPRIVRRWSSGWLCKAVRK